VQQLLESASPDLVPPDRILQGSSVEEAPPDFPFIIHKYSIGNRSVSGRGRPGLEVWVYDRPGSYLRIDKILRDVRYRFAGYPFTTSDGEEHIAVVDWTNDSADLPAEEFHGITRMSAFNLVGRSA
jgi:hypothetical protein